MKLLFVTLFLTTPLFYLSCNSNSGEKYTSDSLNDSTSISGFMGDSVKLVKTASINFKVKDVDKSTRMISNLAQKFGGMIYNQSYEAPEDGRNELKISADSIMLVTNYTPRADITVRVPSENLEEFIYAVADIGYFTGSSYLNIDDKSIAYLENVLKQKNRTEALSTPEYNKERSFTKLQAIGVKDEAIEHQIANRIIDQDVNYTSIHLNLFQNSLIRKEVIANYITSDYQLSFGKRLANALNDGWRFFLTFIIVLTNWWMFILLTIAIIFTYKFLPQKGKLNVHTNS